MKQVAAAKIRRAEAARQARASLRRRARARCCGDLIGAVASVDHPFMKPGSAGAPAGIVLITADKGLAGAFNSNVIRAAEQLRARARRTRVTTPSASRRATRCGGMGNARSSRRGRSAATSKLDTARDGRAPRQPTTFAHGSISEIVLVSQQLVTMMSQRPADAQARADSLPQMQAALRGSRASAAESKARRGRSSSRRRRSSCSRASCRSISSSRSTPRCSKPMPRSSPRSSSR